MTRRAVVTGCAGFIGSTLVDRLLADGWEVVGVDSFEDYYDRGAKELNLRAAGASSRFRLLEANLLELGEGTRSGLDIASSLRSANAVFHLAAQAGVRASWGADFGIYVRNNIMATQVLLEECLRCRPESLVYASSSSVYGDAAVLPMQEDAECRPHSPYGVSKLAGEHLCRLYARNFALQTVSLRFFTVYGPRQRPDMGFNKFIRAIVEGRPICVYGDGTQTRDFTYVDDIVEGIIRATHAPAGSVYNLGGGSRVGLMSVLETLGRIMGPVQIVHGSAQAGDVRDTSADIARARSELDYVPQVSLEEGLTREVEWLQQSMLASESADS